MTKVRVVKPAITVYGAFNAGQVVDIPDDMATAWVKAGLAEPELTPLPEPLESLLRGVKPRLRGDIGSGIMSTVGGKKDAAKRGPKQKALPQELITQWAGEGMGSKAIASRLKRELGIKVSYKTIQRALNTREVEYAGSK